ncbi:Phospholipid N-methyltransferase [Hoeflea phototrophica DFL-43]|uniref:Phospholipid N-methyltransferase n=2 Tax=Hoeflea TaxID=274591 RepID=A9CV62_HOEPD|nr:Phospholipid N-methyltransferase [Hoeflea phototrophica DFL-43]
MTMNFPRRFAEHFDEEIRFFRTWMNGPRNTGAILPTSTIAARSMASLVEPASGLPVLELGPGTGVITRAILDRGVEPSNLMSVEFCAEFHARLMLDLPRVNFIHGNAFDLDTTLGENRKLEFDCVISGIPLLNFPVSDRLMLLEDLLDRLPAGRPVVQFSYGLASPVPAQSGSFEVIHHDFVMRNVPPARIWLYRRGA